MRTLTARELNRALLARQGLLARLDLPLPAALEAIGGIQAFIFALLTVLYFAMARGTGHEHDEHLDDHDDVTAASDEAASAQHTPVPAA